jgi:uncharacterized protein YjbJ (UPF0337 family)
MNWDTVQGNWKEFTGEIKKRWGKLTDDDLEWIKGQQDKLVGRLQKRYGILKDEAEMEVGDFLNESHEEEEQQV